MSALRKRETKKEDMKFYVSLFFKNIKAFKENLNQVANVKDNTDALKGFHVFIKNLNSLYEVISILRLPEEYKLKSSISKLLDKIPSGSHTSNLDYVDLFKRFEKKAQKFIKENNLSFFDFNVYKQEQADLAIPKKRLEIQKKMEDEKFIEALHNNMGDHLGKLSTLRALVEDLSKNLNSCNKQNINESISKIILSLYVIGINAYRNRRLRDTVIDSILDLENLKKTTFTNENLQDFNKVALNVLENLNFAVHSEFNKIDKLKIRGFFPKFAVSMDSQKELDTKSQLSWQRKTAAGAVVATALGSSIYGIVEQFIRNNNWFASGSSFFTTGLENLLGGVSVPSATGDACMAIYLTVAVLVVLLLLAVLIDPGLTKTSSIDENVVQEQNTVSVTANA
jgi:hypothetical protein